MMRFGDDCTCKGLADYAQDADLGPAVIRAMIDALQFYERLAPPWGIESTGAWKAVDCVPVESTDSVTNFRYVTAPSDDLLADKGGRALDALAPIPERLKALGIKGEGACAACSASGRVVAA